MADDSRVLSTLKQQAWERAKGELQSMLVAVWTTNATQECKFLELNREIDEFVSKVESEGLHE